MNLFSRRYINEEISPDGGPHFPSFLSSVHRTWGEPSGTHPNGKMFGGIGGTTPHGIRSTSALVSQSYYGGLYPLSLQPKLAKPEPWQE